MIQLVEGEPRSGKSYFVVNYLCKFTDYDELYGEYILKDNVLIISNIDGLRIKHWTLNYCLGLEDDEKLDAADEEKVKAFFSYENFERILEKTGKSHIILAIDEVHELWPTGYHNKSIYSFFAKHGHLGLDVFFMTQGIESMSRMFNPLIEFITKVAPRSKKISPMFSYDKVSKKGRFMGNKQIPKKKLVFGAYKSFDHDEQNKPKPVAMYWAASVLAVFCIGGYGLTHAIANLGGADKNQDQFGVSSDVVNSELKAISLPVEVEIDEVPDPIPNQEVWRTYYLDGFIEQADRVVYMINGETILDCDRFRNFDRISKTVEYFGKPLRENDSRSFESQNDSG